MGVFSLRRSGTLSSFLFSFFRSASEKTKTEEMGSPMLPYILSLPALSLPALSLSKGRRVEGQAKRHLNARPRKIYRFERRYKRPRRRVRSADGKSDG